jgi:hypothetical protein
MKRIYVASFPNKSTRRSIPTRLVKWPTCFSKLKAEMWAIIESSEKKLNLFYGL